MEVEGFATSVVPPRFYSSLVLGGLGLCCCKQDYILFGRVGDLHQDLRLHESSMSQRRTAMSSCQNYNFSVHTVFCLGRIGHMDDLRPFSKGRMHSIALRAQEVSSEGHAEDENSSSKGFRWPDAKRPRICILGGGFGGLYTALCLDSLPWSPDKRPQVLLVDQSDRFVFKPMLYELLSKEVDLWEVAPSFRDLLMTTSIQFQQDRLNRISVCDVMKRSDGGASKFGKISGTVHLESGLMIDYDWLVLALGAESQRQVVPGAMEHAWPFSSLVDALEVDKRLKILEQEKFRKLDSQIRVVVVGAGYCGVELVATLAERLGERAKLLIVDATLEICPSAPPGNREAAYKVLQSRNVELVLGFIARGIRWEGSPTGSQGCPMYFLDLMPVNKASRRFGANEITTLQADLILWTVGSKSAFSSAAVNTQGRPFPLNGRGQVEIDEFLRVKGYPMIFAIGDSAYLRDSSGRPLPTTAQVAIQEADYTGWNLWAAINGRPHLHFRYQNLGEMMTLGKTDGAVTLSFVDGLTVDGPLAHTARKLAYLYRLPTNEHRLKVGSSWFTKSVVDGLAFLHDTASRSITIPN